MRLTCKVGLTVGACLAGLSVACPLTFGDKPPAASSPASNTRPATSQPTTAPESNEHKNTIGMTFRRIESGTFMMGDKAGDKTNRPFEVRISRGYFIGVTEVTQAQWMKVMSTNPSATKGEQVPVNMVTWDDAVEFCRKLSKLEKRTYRLPTEAEWEYACRAGTTTAYSWGDSEARLPQYAWYNGNAHGVPQPVAGKRPNPWGLYDMHGNVREWCSDWSSWRYPTEPQIDPTGPSKGVERVRRGGFCGFYAEACRSGARDWASPDTKYSDLGFRVVLDLQEKN